MIRLSHRFKLILFAEVTLAILFFPSCLKDIPESLPENLEWNPQLALPLGEEDFGMNSNSGFDTILLEENTLSGLPNWMDQVEVVMQGEFDFDLRTISENLDKLNRILFRINCTNQFPQTIYSQAYFCDGNGTYIDSMFQEGPVETPAAEVRDQGTYIDPGKAQHDALIEGERISDLADALTILFRSSFLVVSVDTSLIRAYPSFHFHIDSGLMFDLSFED